MVRCTAKTECRIGNSNTAGTASRPANPAATPRFTTKNSGKNRLGAFVVEISADFPKRKKIGSEKLFKPAFPTRLAGWPLYILFAERKSSTQKPNGFEVGLTEAARSAQKKLTRCSSVLLT
ncbi:MAG: hypothetical protein KJ901_13360 [Gammaproteobacteria bacterium]|nr:hypothetical protein [Gammaproteobacteria bacterium]MBU1443882.1 hypothetical protein [Gammaproteobacteria bacterium]